MGEVPVIEVAALYVDVKGGPYPHIPGVECWGLPYRDARQYAGPWPVVAHPPCGPWGRLRHLSKNHDPYLALIAVDQVREWRGVLEHPAGSLLWDAVAMPRPGQPSDQFGGVTVEVNQVEWGHACVKPTWLYLVGVETTPAPPFPDRKPTHGIWYGDFERSGGAGPVLLGASKEIRRRTPPLFARWLVDLAKLARKEAA